MTTLVCLILIAITRIGLAIRPHESKAPQENPVAAVTVIRVTS